MNETKFTPGPWRMELTCEDRTQCWEVSGPGKNEWVCDCGDGGNSEDCARLIAASPEMYDVIRRLIERWEQLEAHEATMHEFSCTVQDARDVLAKAVQS